MRINQGKSDRHGGPEHRYWSKVLANHLKARGYEVAEEVPVGGGKTIDLVATGGGKRIAFEIETGKSDAVANMRKCLDVGVERVIVVAVSARMAEILRARIPDHPRIRLVTGVQALREF